MAFRLAIQLQGSSESFRKYLEGYGDLCSYVPSGYADQFTVVITNRKSVNFGGLLADEIFKIASFRVSLKGSLSPEDQKLIIWQCFQLIDSCDGVPESLQPLLSKKVSTNKAYQALRDYIATP